MLEQSIDFNFEFSAENTSLSGSVIAVAEPLKLKTRRTGIEPVPSDYESDELPNTQPPYWRLFHKKHLQNKGPKTAQTLVNRVQ